MLDLDGSACVIDWTQIDISDTRFDLAWTLLLIGSIESEIWRIRVLREYERLLGRPVEDLDFFEVAAGVKRLYSSYLSISIGAENLGMRPGAEQIMMENAPKLHAAYRMMFSYTRIRIPELGFRSSRTLRWRVIRFWQPAMLQALCTASNVQVGYSAKVSGDSKDGA
jgi:hypothetical protein